MEIFLLIISSQIKIKMTKYKFFKLTSKLFMRKNYLNLYFDKYNIELVIYIYAQNFV